MRARSAVKERPAHKNTAKSKTKSKTISNKPDEGPQPDGPDRVWRDHLIMLLHIAAGIEHALMVQYLYAAYSLCVEQMPTKPEREMVERWQRSILAIAKEEMGHLLTVQNILTLLGGPINLDREDFPWDAPYHPFDFKLEPLTMESLEYYVYAEMPKPDDENPEERLAASPGIEMEATFQEFSPKVIEDYTKKITKTVIEDLQVQLAEARVNQQPDRVRDLTEKLSWAAQKAHQIKETDKVIKKFDGQGQEGHGQQPHRVGKLYEEIIELIGDPNRIPDSAFQEDTYRLQASWDDWGRGYQPDPRRLDARGNIIAPDPSRQDAKEKPLPSEREAHVLIAQVATRTQAVEALRAISGQGEAPHLEEDSTGEPSHFERFLEIYMDFERLRRVEGSSPSRMVPVNPSTRPSIIDAEGKSTTSYISEERSRNWATLFNLRYRMLLTYLAHTFQLARVTRADEPSVRAVTMHRVFGEMYNLKTIAGILMQLPLSPQGGPKGTSDGSLRAGPPFEIPYSLRLPQTETDIWRLHHDLLTASVNVCAVLLAGSDEDERRYLQMLFGLDCQTAAWIEKFLAGLGSTVPDFDEPRRRFLKTLDGVDPSAARIQEFLAGLGLTERQRV